DTDEEVDEQELEAHYSYMAKIQEVPTTNSNTDSEPLEQIQKQLKKANTTLAQELTECKVVLAETSKSLGESISDRDSCLVALQTKQTEFEKLIPDGEETLALERESRSKLHKDKVRPYDYTKLNSLYEIFKPQPRNALAELQCMYLHKVKECDCLARKLSNQTKSVCKEVHSELLKRFAKVEKHSISLEIDLQKNLKAKLQDKNIAISELKKLIEKGNRKSVDTKFDKPSIVRQTNAQRIPKPSVLGVNHKPNVNRPQLKSSQSRDKVLQNNSQVKVKKTQNILNSKNKNVDTTPRYKNDDHSGQFGTQRTVNVADTREKVGSHVVQKSGIQCFNCKEYGHFAKECRKPKRIKEFAYHKEKMLLCKQAEQAHYRYMAKIQEVPIADSGTDSEPVEQVQNESGYNVFANRLQHSKQSESVTCLVETNDSNVTPDSPDMCED
nr:hypothetical protein [Tanacetum cinerariifolium]